MTRAILAAVTVLACGLAGGALADPPAPATPAAAVSKPAKTVERSRLRPLPRDRIVCKDEPAPTGSLFGAGQRCQTQSQWDEQHRDAEDQLNHMSGAGPSGH